jgi:hypothetical protein
MYLAEDFRPIMRRFDLHHLDASQATAIGVRADDSVGYVNAHWYTFARDNGVEDPGSVWDLARPIPEAILPPLRPFYEHLFRKARTSHEEGSHDYECSAPHLYRRFHLRVVPLEHDALLLLHHLEVSKPIGKGSPAIERFYRDESGMITQCCHCRMVRRVKDLETWDWVAAWVDRADPDTSHGLCPECLAVHYPKLAERYATWRDERVQRALQTGSAAEAGLNGD